ADLLIFPFLAGFIPLDLLGPWWIFTSVLMFFQLRLLKQEKTAFFVPLGISWFCIRVFVLIDFL
ncbi:MAG TPA: hypothetical protein VI959_02890, partial [Alphaproteobacteria bacterium]|nr:hypothetical protein [Alphaproteobacteria bacterium]